MNRPTTNERAQHAYSTIDAFGWSITWSGKGNVPDDAWPIDIIRRAINAELLDLSRELNTLKWMGADEGWELAIKAVRKHLIERAQGIEVAKPARRDSGSTSGESPTSQSEDAPK